MNFLPCFRARWPAWPCWRSPWSLGPKSAPSCPGRRWRTWRRPTCTTKARGPSARRAPGTGCRWRSRSRRSCSRRRRRWWADSTCCSSPRWSTGHAPSRRASSVRSLDLIMQNSQQIVKHFQRHQKLSIWKRKKLWKYFLALEYFDIRYYIIFLLGLKI